MILAEDLGGLLFGIHHHHPCNDKIIYYEDDLIKLLVKLGFPKPKWGKALNINEYETKEKTKKTTKRVGQRKVKKR